MIFLSCMLVLGRLDGWYYFEENERRLDPEEAQDVLQMEKARQQNLLALALMEPSRENTAAYMRAHKSASDESRRFAETWAEILEQGRLDPAFSKRYFLLLVFRGDAASLEAAKIAKQFAALTSWRLKGLSLDGASVEGMDSEIDRGLGALLACEETPSFYAIDPEESAAILLGSDIASSDELETRILERCEL